MVLEETCGGKVHSTFLVSFMILPLASAENKGLLLYFARRVTSPENCFSGPCTELADSVTFVLLSVARTQHDLPVVEALNLCGTVSLTTIVVDRAPNDIIVDMLSLACDTAKIRWRAMCSLDTAGTFHWRTCRHPARGSTHTTLCVGSSTTAQTNTPSLSE